MEEKQELFVRGNELNIPPHVKEKLSIRVALALIKDLQQQNLISEGVYKKAEEKAKKMIDKVEVK